MLSGQKYGAEWALVTGASSGLGHQICRRLAEQGVKIVLVAKDREGLERTRDEISTTSGVECRVVDVDLSRDASCDQLFEQTKDIDVGLLFSNAGYIAMEGYHQSSTLDKRANVQCNAVAHLNIVDHYYRRMVEKSHPGAIIITSSITGQCPTPNSALYSASKAMLSAFAASLSLESYHFNIDILAVQPGYVSTRLFDSLPQHLIFKLLTENVFSNLTIRNTYFNQYPPGSVSINGKDVPFVINGPTLISVDLNGPALAGFTKYELLPIISLIVFQLKEEFLSLVEDSSQQLLLKETKYLLEALQMESMTLPATILQELAPSVGDSSNDLKQFRLSGKNFGKVPANVVLKVDDNVIPVNDDLTHFVLTFPITKEIAYASTKSVFISVNGNDMAPNAVIKLAPVVDSITSVPTKGGMVTITGKFLSLQAPSGTPFTSDIDIGGIKCTNPTNPAADTIVCNLVAGTGSNKLVKITINSLPSKEDIRFAYGVPQIQKVSQEADVVTLNGLSFGDKVSTKITLGGIEIAPSSISQSGDSEVLTFTIPTNARSGPIVITAGDQVSKPVAISIRPILKSVTSTHTSGGTVTLKGSFLNALNSASAPVPVVVKIGTQDCINVREAQPPTHTDLLCDIGVGTGKNLEAVVTIDDQTSLDKITYAYFPPSVSSYYQINNQIFIIGNDFGIDQSAAWIDFGEHIFQLGNVSQHTLFNFTIPEDQLLGNSTLVVAHQVSAPFEITIRPSITSISTVPTNGGLVTVQGHFFHIAPAAENSTESVPSTDSITVGNSSCTDIIQISTQMLTCTIAPGYDVGHMVNITINNVTNSEFDPLVLFSYVAPTVSTVTVVDENGGLVTIVGTSFNNPSIVKVGAVECVGPEAFQFNTIICFLNKWDFANGDIPEDLQDVSVSVGSQTASNKIFSYNLDNYHERKRIEKKNNRLKWLIPAILVPALIGVIAIIAVTIILIKKHKKMAALRKMFRK
eukprot:gene15092-17867_t